MTGMKAYHRMIVCAACFLAGVIGTTIPATARAWGAVAFDPQSAAHGVSINRATRAEAEQEALAACAGQSAERTCQIVFTATRTGFLAVAASGNAIGVSLAFSDDRAAHSAIQACQRNAEQARGLPDLAVQGMSAASCRIIWSGEEKIGDGEPYNFLEPTYEWRGTKPVPPPPPRPEDR